MEAWSKEVAGSVLGTLARVLCLLFDLNITGPQASIHSFAVQLLEVLNPLLGLAPSPMACPPELAGST